MSRADREGAAMTDFTEQFRAAILGAGLTPPAKIEAPRATEIACALGGEVRGG